MRSWVYSLGLATVLFAFSTEAAFALSASKAAARTTEDDAKVIDCEQILDNAPQGCGTWTTILGLNIKAPGNNKEFIVGGSAVTNIMNLNQTASKGGKKSTTTTDAGVIVRIVMDPTSDNAGASGTVALPGPVVYNRRLVELSATLEGQIADCLTVNDQGVVVLDEDCVSPEVIELLIETWSAHHFNFVFPDVPVGEHRIELQMLATALASESGECLNIPDDPVDDLDCDAEASVIVNEVSLTVEQVQFVKGDEVVDF